MLENWVQRGGWVAAFLRLLGWCVVTTVALPAADPLRVVATTSMVGDLVRQVGGDAVRVDVLMGPGVDPHLYKASASDVLKLQRARVVFYNGLFLEGKMTDLFGRMRARNPHLYGIADALSAERLLAAEDAAGHPDPHVWFDVSLWADCVPAIVRGLSAADPARAATYQANGDRARVALRELHDWTIQQLAILPPERRVLVTSHDAYSYFGRAYNFQVVGLQGISTVSEAALADMAALVDYIRAHQVPAIFVESSVPPGAIRRIAQDAGVRVGGELFSDALGRPGQELHGFDVGTYMGMVRANVTTLVEALR